MIILKLIGIIALATLASFALLLLMIAIDDKFNN